MEDCAEVDVIIIGSGMAGLGAGRVLFAEGLKILVLEGRDRSGGRVYTATLPAIQDLPSMEVDLGANYLIGCSTKYDEQPLWGLAKIANVETAICAGDLLGKYGGWECPEVSSWKNYETGDDIPMELVVSMCHLYDTTVSLTTAKYLKLSTSKRKTSCIEIIFYKCMHDILTLLFNNGLRTVIELSDIEKGVFDALITRLMTYQSPMNRLNIEILQDVAVSCERDITVFKVKALSEREIAEWTRMIKLRLEAMKDNPPCVTNKVNDFHEDKLVTNRFSNFIDLLEIDLPMKFSQTVKSIDYSKDEHILVTCVQSDTKEVSTYFTKYVVVTIPVGVLAELDHTAAITFHPPLPQHKVDAIKRLALPFVGAETHNKIILRYHPSDVFWDADAPHLKTNHKALHILNFHAYGKPGLLVCHVWGGSGIKTIDYTDSELVSIILDILQGMYQKQGRLPQPIQTLVTRWSQDPFSLGSYTPGGKDSTNDDRIAYANNLPEAPHKPRLFFAGEGTLDDLEAKECTHGALLSGMQRAAQIVNLVYPRRTFILDKPFNYLKRKLKSARSSINAACNVKKSRTSDF